jgi:NAD(P)-dependent dehydrogenase (short-subunit alcohol dehydrogenase family)
VADINEENARKTAQQSSEYAADPTYQSFGIHVDVADEQSVQKMVETAVKGLGGRIDYFVNCAGAPNMSSFPISDLNTEHYDRVVRINLYGTINCMKAVSAIMKSQEPLPYIPSTRRASRHPERSLGRSSIVNLGSVNSILANPGNMSYVTSKHAVLAATKVAALDLAKNMIRVNVVLPGPTDTPMLASTF